MRCLLPVLLVVLAGCVVAPAPKVRHLGDVTLNRDQTWSGRIVIAGRVKLVNGASLILEPGTEVLFRHLDRDQDGQGDAAIEIERGRLIARGTPLAPIVFRSAQPRPQPGDWLEIKVDFSRDIELSWCRIEHSAHGLHAHFSRGHLTQITLADNIDGTRLGQGRYLIENSLVTGNTGKGINFRNSNVTIENSLLVGNHTGVFVFETDRDQRIENNLFAANGRDVRLGDFFAGDLMLGPNRFAGNRPLAARLYDRGEDGALGVIGVTPEAGLRPQGPRATVRLTDDWQVVTGGYVDAGAVVDGGVAWIGGWDGMVRALAADGRVLWQVPVGDVVDAGAAIDARRIYVQTWSRQVVALNREDGTVLWRHDYAPSEHDDHRQGGLLRWRDLLLVPAWNGNLIALDPANGKVRWQVDCGLPLRSAPVAFAGGVLQASGSGQIILVDADGGIRWRHSLGQPLLSAPATTDDRACVLGREGLLVCLDSVGQKIWQRQVAGPAWYAAPTVADGLVHVATGAGMLATFALADGTLLWQKDISEPVYATPTIVGPWLAVAGNRGGLRLFSRFDGTRQAAWQGEGAIQSSPVLFAGRLLAGSRDGSVHALKLDLPSSP